ncbi:MAG: AI-2E family transporter [Chloroflexi bacterium]|nr:AI-2E family transporter [Chloroflexota bacterium]
MTTAGWEERNAHQWAHRKNIVLTLIGVVVLCVGAAFALQRVVNIVLIVLMAAVVAYVAEPAVTWLGKRRVPQPVAIGTVYLAVIALLIVGGRLLLAQVVPELPALPRALDGIVANVRQLESDFGQPGVLTTGVRDFLSTRLASVASTSGIEVIRTIGDGIVNVVITLVISMYLVSDGRAIPGFLMRVVPPAHQGKVVFLEQHLARVVGGYIRGQLTMALIISLTTALALAIFRVPFAPVIGVLAFLLALIPVVGTVLTGVVALMAASLNGLGTALAVIALYTVLHVIESDVLGPRITGRAVGVHPAISILVLIAGGQLFGIWGAALAVPVTGLAIVIGRAVYVHWRAQYDAMQAGAEPVAAGFPVRAVLEPAEP